MVEERETPKARSKVFPQVIVWGGISVRGQTSLALVNGTINARKYCDILEEHLLEFVTNKFPDGWHSNRTMLHHIGLRSLRTGSNNMTSTFWNGPATVPI